MYGERSRTAARAESGADYCERVQEPSTSVLANNNMVRGRGRLQGSENKWYMYGAKYVWCEVMDCCWPRTGLSAKALARVLVRTENSANRIWNFSAGQS